MTSIVMRRPHLRDLPRVAPLPEGYALRLARGDEDLAPLAATLSAAFADPWDADRVRAKLTATPDVQAVYMVTWRGLPVATASSRWLPDRFPDAGYVHWVGTHPDHSRRGLAAALLARLLRDFAERGRASAVLETHDFRAAALRAYLKFGFTPEYDVAGEDHRPRWSAIFQTLFGG